MKRREFITLLGGAAAAWPLAARAQQQDRMRRIGVLMPQAESDPEQRSWTTAFATRLRELGWRQGENAQIDYRWLGGDTTRAASLAKELVDLQPDVLLAATPTVAVALRQYTLAIPIVFTQVSDPVAAGLVTNLARPEGNITGFTVFEFAMAGKWRSRSVRQAGWIINDKRVERIWRREGLKVPHKQPKRGRLWLTNGSCIRLRPEQRNHVWSYDFVEDRTHDGRKYRMLNVLDEFTHECLAIRVARKLKAIDVIDVLSDLFILRGIPAHIRSDNGPEFVAKAVQEWIAVVGAETAYIERGSPWENGCRISGTRTYTRNW